MRHAFVKIYSSDSCPVMPPPNGECPVNNVIFALTALAILHGAPQSTLRHRSHIRPLLLRAPTIATVATGTDPRPRYYRAVTMMNVYDPYSSP